MANAENSPDLTFPAVTTQALDGPQRAAVIFFGPASVCMLTGECNAEGEWSEVQTLERPINLARDIFRDGEISRETMDQCAEALRSYRLSYSEYDINKEKVRCFATNILLEAANQEIFLNRMQVAGHIQVDPIDDGLMTRLIYLTVLRLMRRNPRLMKSSALVIHVGPGNTRILYFDKGSIATYHSYRLGAFRVQESLANGSQQKASQVLEKIEDNIHGVLEQILKDFEKHEIDHLVAIGTEIQQIAATKFHLNPKIEGAYAVNLAELEKLSDWVRQADLDKIARECQISYPVAEGLAASLQTNHVLLEMFQKKKAVLLPVGDFHEEMLKDLLAKSTDNADFKKEVLQSAKNLALRYNCDLDHAVHVEKLARAIFKQSAQLHGLSDRHELVLRVASIVHEVGMFVSAREHHKHSQYILENSELFGLSVEERIMVSLLVRYHRRYDPNKAHPWFAELSRKRRLLFYKLCSILRLADSLDRRHMQLIKTIRLESRREILTIYTPDVTDVSLEQIMIDQKCHMFRDIYGLEVVLVGLE